jgi:hypothetical protein
MHIRKFENYIAEIFNPKKIQGRDEVANKLKIISSPPHHLVLNGETKFRDYNSGFAKVYGDDHAVSGNKNWEVWRKVRVELFDTDNNGQSNDFTLNKLILSVNLTSEFSEPWDKKLYHIPNAEVGVDEGELVIDPNDVENLAEFVAKTIVYQIHGGIVGMLDDEDEAIRKRYNDFMFDAIPLFKQKLVTKFSKKITVKAR